MDIDLNIISFFLKTKFIGKNVIIFDEVDSTNTQARIAAERGEVNGTALISENQTAGRGRQGHSWDSHRGKDILMSVLLYPKGGKNHFLSTITLAVGVAVGRALEQAAKIQTDLKWPNDILVKGKKICGILCEGFTRNNNDCIAIGIGVNVNGRSFPKSISDKATSLSLAKGENFIREEIISQILNELEVVYSEFCLGKLDEIMKEYRSKCISIGKSVEFIKDNHKFMGIIEDISLNGELIIRTNDQKIRLNSLDKINQGIYN